MKAKALSMFRTKLHYDDEKTVLVTIGQVIEGDDEHLRELARNRLVELVEGGAEPAAKPATAKAATKTQATAKPGAAAKPAKAKAEAKTQAAAKPGAAAKTAKSKAVVGKTESAPLAGKGEGVQMPAPEGTETLPPVQSAPEGGEGKE